MKHTNTDDKTLAELLKKSSYHATENEWFTPRVLNRLPEPRHTTLWLRVALYAIVIGGVFGCWIWFSHTQDSSVITVRHLICYTSMIGGCMAVTGIAAIGFFKSE